MKKSFVAFLYLFSLLIIPKFECLADNYQKNFKNDGLYIIDEIKVQGNKNIPPSVFVSLSGLSKGNILKLSDTTINDAMNKIWKRHIVDDVSILAKIISKDRISILIKVKIGEILTECNFEGLSEKEEDVIRHKCKILRGSVITNSFIKVLKDNIKAHLAKKGYLYPNIKITKHSNKNITNGISLDIKITKNDAQKVHKIYFKGNKAFSSKDLKHKMILTKEVRRESILVRSIKSIFSRVFRTYKSPKDRFIKQSYFKDEFYTIYSNLFGSYFKEMTFEGDLERGIKRELYYKHGYIDATITKSEFIRFDEQTVDLYVEIYEGPRYILNEIKWVGNKLFTDEELSKILKVKTKRYFDRDTLEKNLIYDPEYSIRSLYHNFGYIFSNISYEIYKIDGNKVDIIIKIDEGIQATINKVNISGIKISKDRTIRKYLYSIPTHKYSNSDVLRSKDNLGRAGIIKVNKFKSLPIPNKEDGTVDLEFILEENLDVQFQAKISVEAQGLTGGVSGQFNNLSLGRIFKKELPFGGGQTGKIGFQKSKRHTKFSVDLYDPWIINWGRYPINFDISLWHLWEDQSQETIYPPINRNPLATSKTFDGKKLLQIKPGYDGFLTSTGLSVAMGKKLSWLEDTTVSSGISYSYRKYKEYKILPNDEKRRTGKSIDFYFNLGIGKDNTDSLFYPRKGYKIGLSGILTPPYSLFDDKDPTDISNKFTEYHRWTFYAQKYNKIIKDLILAIKFEMGFLGAYSSKYGVGPYRRYYLGGEGYIEDSNSVLSQSAIPLRGYSQSFHVPISDSGQHGGIIFDKLTFEIRHLLSFIKFMPIYALIFCEAGNTWADYNKFSISEVFGYASYGFGFCAVVPMLGPLSINFGFAIDKENKNVSPEIHFKAGIS